METLITGSSVLISLEEHLNLSGDTARCLRRGAPRLLKPAMCTAGLGPPAHDSRGIDWKVVHQHYMLVRVLGGSKVVKEAGRDSRNQQHNDDIAIPLLFLRM